MAFAKTVTEDLDVGGVQMGFEQGLELGEVGFLYEVCVVIVVVWYVVR